MNEKLVEEQVEERAKQSDSSEQRKSSVQRKRTRIGSKIGKTSKAFSESSSKVFSNSESGGSDTGSSENNSETINNMQESAKETALNTPNSSTVMPGEPTLSSLDAFFASLEYQNEAFVYTNKFPLTSFTGHTLYRFSDVIRLGSLRDEIAMAFNTFLSPLALVEKLSTAKNFEKSEFKKLSEKVSSLYMS